MSNERFYNNKKSLGLIFWSLSLILFLLIVAMATLKPAVAYDDYFTLGIVRLPFEEMIRATANNVHPPLYYMILKIFCKIFDPLDNHSLISLGKAVSLIPLALLLVLSFTKVKKEFGILAAGIFSFLLASSFNVMIYATVIRMYSWGLFFITIQLIYLYDLIHRKGTTFAWFVFTIASMCAIYTHYFAAIASIIIYLILFAYLLHSNRDELKKWIISAIASFLSYLPWIGILINQIGAVTKDYWIEPISLETFLSYIDFIFLPSNGIIPKIFEVLLIVFLIVLIYFALRNRKSGDDYVDFSMISISIIFFTLISGVVLSFLIRPIFIARYIVPCFGGLFLGLSILLARCFDNKNNSKAHHGFETRKLFYFGIMLILLISIFNVAHFIDDTSADYNETMTHHQFFDSINDGRVVIFDDSLSYLRYSPYLENDTCIYDSSLRNIEKNKEENTVIFDKSKSAKLDNTDYQYKKIFEIYQDEVYLFA